MAWSASVRGLGQRVLACSRELPGAWRTLHTSAVCAKVSAAAGSGGREGGWAGSPRDRTFAPRIGRRESAWPRGTSR
ncbi:mitochondrial ribosomal protein S24, isoform CRA_b [Mus musculus]|nr:mitochondrial ribosomal protein S24, isoform CRA_b [Mus musculus]